MAPRQNINSLTSDTARHLRFPSHVHVTPEPIRYKYRLFSNCSAYLKALPCACWSLLKTYPWNVCISNSKCPFLQGPVTWQNVYGVYSRVMKWCSQLIPSLLLSSLLFDLSFWKISVSKMFSFFQVKNCSRFYFTKPATITSPIPCVLLRQVLVSAPWGEGLSPTSWALGGPLTALNKSLWWNEAVPVPVTETGWTGNSGSCVWKANWHMKVWLNRGNRAGRSLSCRERPWRLSLS